MPKRTMPLSALERKAAMVLRGLTQREMAEDLGVSRALVGMVLTGKHRNERIERYIAQQLGRPMADVFESRDTQNRATVAVG